MPNYIYCPECAAELIKNESGLPTCPDGHFTKYRTPVASAIAIIRNGDEYLFLRRAREPRIGAWCLPGGFIDPNETAQNAVLREISEETQLTDLRIVSMIGTFPSNYGGIEDTIAIGYLLESENRNVILSEENDQFIWCKLSDAPTLAFRDCQQVVQDVKDFYSQSL